MRNTALLVTALLALSGLTHAQTLKAGADVRKVPSVDTAAAGAVPEVYAITGQFERVEVLRLKYQSDLLAGLQKKVAQEGIRNAVILAGIGSVRSYHYHAVSNRTFPSEQIFVKDTAASADIAGMNGYVIDGRVHAHITLADGQKAFGGHLEPGTSVFTFAIVTLGVLKEGMDLRRTDDKTYR